jgi:hypothetical protein
MKEGFKMVSLYEYLYNHIMYKLCFANLLKLIELKHTLCILPSLGRKNCD